MACPGIDGCGKFSWRILHKLVKIGNCCCGPRRNVYAQEPIMESTPKLSREAYIQAMRQRVENLLGQVADAVNAAAPGQIITASEEKVRDLFADLRRQAFEQAVQMRMDAAEAAFPPSEGPRDTTAETQ
jgi:metal-dependent amidase/aminoacylase/carboxypeptidase family protein